MISGFDTEFENLDQYIRVITERIWEGRRLDDIHRYYSDDCIVETPLGISTGVGPVIDGTRATLAEFPDRELLAEDILVSGDAAQGLLSSHRIYSPMTHRGDGRFGKATGLAVEARTIADCVCRDNRIVHEWLVRDHGAIARQLGWSLPDLARHWLKQQPDWSVPSPTVAPLPYRPEHSTHPLASATVEQIRANWTADSESLSAHCDRAMASTMPGGVTVTGLHAFKKHWQTWQQSLTLRHLHVEHLATHLKAQQPLVVSVRWRAQVQHTGPGLFGDPTEKEISILAIQHLEWVAGRIRRQWLLIDELALWMQLLRP